MKVFVLVLALMISSCASTQTEKQKEDRKKLTIIRAMSCIVIPTLPTCVIPGK